MQTIRRLQALGAERERLEEEVERLRMSLEDLEGGRQGSKAVPDAEPGWHARAGELAESLRRAARELRER